MGLFDLLNYNRKTERCNTWQQLKIDRQQAAWSTSHNFKMFLKEEDIFTSCGYSGHRQFSWEQELMF